MEKPFSSIFLLYLARNLSVQLNSKSSRTMRVDWRKVRSLLSPLHTRRHLYQFFSIEYLGHGISVYWFSTTPQYLPISDLHSFPLHLNVTRLGCTHFGPNCFYTLCWNRVVPHSTDKQWARSSSNASQFYLKVFVQTKQIILVIQPSLRFEILNLQTLTAIFDELYFPTF